ncbi:MAG: tRNA threonylcarbamoyladenosine dehydratase [Prevotellaceae bacterium]|nr:tRNA threonylcarbamoyladenosine dehydratase [Prevotellaceae bacterium]
MDFLQRVIPLLGEEGVERLRRLRVIVFGVGGVGSWCAEALARSGVGRLTLVDPDSVAPSNLNRQLPALSSTLGRLKVEVMRERLLDINPQASILSLPLRYTSETAQQFSLETYDYVVDAIDTLTDKAALILHATGLTASKGSPILLSSTGAGRRIDPTQVRTADFWKVQGDPLAALLRKRFRHSGVLPQAPFQCVYSLEPPKEAIPERQPLNASLCPVTATFGMTLASLIVKE